MPSIVAPLLTVPQEKISAQQDLGLETEVSIGRYLFQETSLMVTIFHSALNAQMGGKRYRLQLLLW